MIHQMVFDPTDLNLGGLRRYLEFDPDQASGIRRVSE